MLTDGLESFQLAQQRAESTYGPHLSYCTHRVVHRARRPAPGDRLSNSRAGGTAKLRLTYEESSDLDLFADWRRGDRRAGSVLARRHLAALHRFFSLRARAHVEDLIQMTFVACIDAVGAFRGDSSFRNYLFGIARIQLHAHYRRQRQRPAFDSISDVLDPVPSPSTLAAEHEEAQLLAHALRCLSLEQQIVLKLSYWEGFSAVEIAQVLRIPENTVHSRLRRGKRNLRTALKQLSEPIARGGRLPDDVQRQQIGESHRPAVPTHELKPDPISQQRQGAGDQQASTFARGADHWSVRNQRLGLAYQQGGAPAKRCTCNSQRSDRPD
jgi:RNA polymerase sigma factor (sigma-70 family)